MEEPNDEDVLNDAERETEEEYKQLEPIILPENELKKNNKVMKMNTSYGNKAIKTVSNIAAAGGKPAYRMIVNTSAAVVTEIATKSTGEILKSASKVNGCVYAISFSLESGYHLYLYFTGKIDKNELGRKVLKSFSSNLSGFALSSAGTLLGVAIGSAICPGLGTLIGSFVGSIVGGLLSSFLLSKKIDELVDEYFPSTKEKMYEKALNTMGCTKNSSQKAIEKLKKQFQVMYHPDKAEEADRDNNRQKYYEYTLAFEAIKAYRKSLGSWIEE